MNRNVRSIYEFDGYLFNGIDRSFFYRGVEIHITKRNFYVLQLLLEKNGNVVTKTEFFDTVWADTFVEDGNLAVSITALRKMFESHSNSAFIETVPRRGYKFTANVKKIYEDDDKFEQESEAEVSIGYVKKVESTSSKGITSNHNYVEIKPASKVVKTYKRRRFLYLRKLQLLNILILIGLVLAIAGGGTAFYYTNIKKPEEKKTILTKVVVFPFENITQIQEADYLSLAFADSLNYSLFSFPTISVISLSQIKPYFNKSYNPIEEGKKLGVSWVVTGSYQKMADKLIVNVVVTDISLQNPVIQQKQFIKTTNDLTDLQGNVVRFIIDRLHLTVSEKDLTKLKKQQTKNLNAYELYLRAANFYANDQLEEAINYYQKSLAADPDFSIASEGLASVYMTQGNAYGCGEVCSNKALEIYDNLKNKDPENDRVSIKLAQAMVELNQAEKAFPILEEVLKKDPKNYFAYNGLNYAYRYVGLIEKSNLMYQKGKVDDNYTVLTEKGHRLYNNASLYEGDYTGFITSLQEDNDSFISRFYQGLGYFYLKDNEKAKILFNEAYEMEPNAMITQIGKSYSYHIDKNKTRGLEMLENIYQNIKINKVYDGEMIYKAAQGFAVFNEKEKALELFDLSIEKGFFCYPYFASDSLLKNIRNETKFQIILSKSRKRYEAFKQANQN